MTGELEYVTFNTEMGWVGILASGKGRLLATTLPQPSAREADQQLGDRVKQARRSPHLSNDLMERLKSYFNGHRVTFTYDIDLS